MKHIFTYTMEVEADSIQEAWDCLQELLEDDSDTQLDVLNSDYWLMEDPDDYKMGEE